MIAKPMQRTLLGTLLLTLAALLSACASVPAQLEGQFADISPARVTPETYGSEIRWGGVIIETEIEQNRTCFEILSRPLSRYLRPLEEDTTAGRFIACKSGFYDPQIYAAGREVTLTGRIQSVEERMIDEFNYRYPTVEVSEMVMWQERPDVVVYNNYDPFYSPFYYGYPYYWGHRSFYRYSYPRTIIIPRKP